MKTLMEWGLIKPGDTVVIVNQDNSEATVLDHKFVRYNGEDISFNAWGSKVTGWSSICIYDWARTSDSDKTLGELRREKMEEIEQKALDESELD